MIRKFLLFLMLASAFGAFGQMRMIPHVTRIGGGFATTVLIENRSVSNQDINLTPYDSDGNLLTAYQSVIEPGLTHSATIAELFADADRVSHFAIDADDNVRVSVIYDFVGGNSSPAHVPESSEEASRWRVFPGNWNTVFDGLAVVNSGSEATDVWVSQRDLEGNYLKAVKIVEQLAPNAKTLYVIGSPDESEFDRETPSYFEISADRKLSVTALRGTLTGSELRLLWSNHSVAVSHSESRRDEKSVWFITDGSLYDVFEMMGYNVATDRLWQLDLFRRRATGRLAEFFGEELLVPDRVVRASSYTAAEYDSYLADLDSDARTMIRAYSDGLNRRIVQVNSDDSILPYEYKSLNLSAVEPVTYRDVMAWLVELQRTFSLDNLGLRQVTNASKLNTLIAFTNGDRLAAGEMFNDMFWINDPSALTMIPGDEAAKKAFVPKKMPVPRFRPGVPDLSRAGQELWDLYENNKRIWKKVGAHIKGGSFAWVISGAKSETGNPILYSGPQMDYTAPSVACEGSIRTEGLNVSGMVIPGIPAIVVGRTPHHAWSFQVGHTNSWDFYFESQNGITENRTEIIKVRNLETGELRDEEALLSRTIHGPIVNRTPLLSWKYSAWGYEFELSKGFLKMATAQSMDEFGEGVANLGASLHVCYGDKGGNIAYWMSGRNPVRPEGEYRFPQGAVALQREYDSEVIHPMPHDRNTPRGWYAGWNTKASLEYDDITSSFHFGRFQRAHVIQEFFQSRENISMQDMLDLEFNIVHTFSIGSGGNPWAFMRDSFIPIVEANPTPERTAALEMLENWDGLFTDFQIPETDILPQWILTRDWLFFSMDKVFMDELGPSGANPGDGTLGDLLAGVQWFNAMLHGLEPDSPLQNTYDWFTNTSDATAPQTMEAVVLQALDEVLLTDLNAGARNMLTFDHDLLGLLHTPSFKNRSIYTQAVELGSEGPVRILSLFGLGQSGNILMDGNGDPVFDPHFFSMVENYDNFIMREFPLFD